MPQPSRRTFLQSSTAAIATTLATTSTHGGTAQASERVRVGIMGAGGRAYSLISTFSSNPNVEVVAIADLDPSRIPKGLATAEKNQGRSIRTESDFRRLIDDDSIDALVIGTPDHWHAIPTILACQAGKDVYVEKPDSHNIVEGMTMVAAMKKHNRIVQMGSQHRSTERLQSAIEFVETGALGRCLVAKAWESSKQGNIGFPPDGTPPAGVDYDMWMGSAPKRPFNRNRFHGTWRWLYDYGTGDLGNDGVHRLDMAVALLNAACRAQKERPVGLPTSVSAHGGKWYFDDAQQFPDTMQVTYEFADGDNGRNSKMLTYEMRVWVPYHYLGQSEGAMVFGDQGSITIGNRSWVAHGRGGKVLAEGTGDSHEKPHVQNFIDCIKSREKPYCDLETVGHPASVLCHAGNIAARVGRTLQMDATTETFVNDDEANALRTRPEYREPWTLPTV
ncbi:Alpha-N-acetylgalactosaminidase [Novipirellula galeiformis]|uniref:Alpha-N-acetylgalactosaminidase n=1 Tax=Novipirellula galeiformis TaxID=2528004 RepID=A0A5C6CHA9_9BACT|nr:Gfo/Idh/MocA family oxidoreductase [Novipirellula galeiformis]TWU22954.1 Alpha-N-acetylgalactosaminidase [Novipirellula galeiformis]